MIPATRLRAAIDQGAVLAPGAWDALSALLVQSSGAPAAFLSGAALSAARLGRADLGHLGTAEVVHTTTEITSRVDLPLVVDIDTGFGGTLQVQRTIALLRRAGAAAVVIEDQVAPKRCGAEHTTEVVGDDEFDARLTAAVEAGADEVLVIARTDLRRGHGLAAALARAERAATRGADLVFVSNTVAPDEVRSVAEATGLPVMVNLSEPATPTEGWPPLHELEEAGARLLIAPVVGLLASFLGIEQTLDDLRRTGPAALGRRGDWDRLMAVLGQTEDLATERRLATTDRTATTEHP